MPVGVAAASFPDYAGLVIRIPCIEFHQSEQSRRAFHSSQLIESAPEPNPDAEDDKNEPPQKLSLAFSTADVVVLGWRLGHLVDKLQKMTWPPSTSCRKAMPKLSATELSSPPSPSRPLPKLMQEKARKALNRAKIMGL